MVGWVEGGNPTDPGKENAIDSREIRTITNVGLSESKPKLHLLITIFAQQNLSIVHHH
jgi:hypothetical protein